MNVSRGEYELAETLADQALQLCRELNLRFAIGACLGFRGGAEVGLRKFRRAERTLAEFAKTTARREDPYFQYLELTLRVKLAISTGRTEQAFETQSLVPLGTASRRGRGEYLATLAIAAAAVGDHASARELAAEAKDLACSVEAVHCSAIAGAITAVGIQEGSESLAALEHAVLTSIEADFRDGVVIAYRAWPFLLHLVRSPVLVSHLRNTIELSNDRILGRRAGLLSPEEEAASVVDSLTPRELQVLELLAAGLSNREIARQLFISHSTAKVHVHHILEKLNVKSRLQAVLKARAFLDRD
jgi:ATP/maltotriose-dependent transcriptional regulator MalT